MLLLEIRERVNLGAKPAKGIKKTAPNGCFTQFLNGGERGIRTLGTLSRTHAFQACSFDHSDISPQVE